MQHKIISFINRCVIILILIVAMPIFDAVLLQKSGWWGIILLSVLSLYLLGVLLAKQTKKKKRTSKRFAFPKKQLSLKSRATKQIYVKNTL